MELSFEANNYWRFIFHKDFRDEVPGANEANAWWHNHKGDTQEAFKAMLEQLDTPYVQSLKVRLIAWKLEGK